MAISCKPDFDKIAQDAQFLRLALGVEAELGEGLVWLTRSAACWAKIPFAHAFGNSLGGKVLQGTAHVSVAITVLKAACEHRIERDSRDDAQLPGLRDCPR